MIMLQGSSSRGMDPFEREERREEERGRLKKERRDFRKHQEAVYKTCIELKIIATMIYIIGKFCTNRYWRSWCPRLVQGGRPGWRRRK